MKGKYLELFNLFLDESDDMSISTSPTNNINRHRPFRITIIHENIELVLRYLPYYQKSTLSIGGNIIDLTYIEFKSLKDKFFDKYPKLLNVEKNSSTIDDIYSNLGLKPDTEEKLKSES